MMLGADGGSEGCGPLSAVCHADYRIEPVYQTLSKQLRNEIIAFWLQSGALSDIGLANERVNQVACVIRDSGDDLVGISTVYPNPDGPDGRLYLNYRMFIHSAHRVPGLMTVVVRTTRGFFEANRPARGGACGMLIFTENPKLQRPGIKRTFVREGWMYAGKDQRGIDVWRFDFPL